MDGPRGLITSRGSGTTIGSSSRTTGGSTVTYDCATCASVAGASFTQATACVSGSSDHSTNEVVKASAGFSGIGAGVSGRRGGGTASRPRDIISCSIGADANTAGRSLAAFFARISACSCRSAASRSRYSFTCAAKIAGSQPSGCAALERVLPPRSRLSRPGPRSRTDGAPAEAASTGMTSVCTALPSAASSRSRAVSAASSRGESSSGVRIRSGTEAAMAASAWSTDAHHEDVGVDRAARERGQAGRLAAVGFDGENRRHHQVRSIRTKRTSAASANSVSGACSML